MNTDNKTLSIPEPIYFEEEPEVLDFEELNRIATEFKKKNLVVNQTELPKEVEFTEKEKNRLVLMVKDMEKHITKYAQDGKFRFFYDCSKVEKHLFVALAQEFKTKNPKFYVEQHFGTQMMVVDWSNKNEV